MWNDVGKAELETEEQNLLNLFLTAIEAEKSNGFDPDKVLLVKAEDGTLKALYGPCIFSAEEKLTLKMGGNSFPVNQDGEDFTIGLLKGRAKVETKKDSAGQEYPYASVIFRSPDKDMFSVPLGLNREENFSIAEIQAVILGGENIAPFLSPPPAGGGNIFKMEELGVGEYEVLAITENEGGQYGTNYTLHLADGRATWSKSNSTIQCGYLMQKGWKPPLTLSITNIEEYADGKVAVRHALRPRQPRMVGTPDKLLLPPIEVPATPVNEINSDFPIDENGKPLF